MSDRLNAAIEELQEQIAQKEQELLPLKQTVNQLCKVSNRDPLYDLSDGGSISPKSKLKWRVDQFFNESLSGSVADILAARKDAGLEGPATIDELYEALVAGGFKFEGTTGNEEHQKRALKTALTKNSNQFVKISENVFGLRIWYRMRAPRNGKKDDVGGPESTDPMATPSEAANENKPVIADEAK
jgi:hypothetical protein